MKKLLAGFIIFISVITAQTVCALAASTSVTVPVEKFSITAGIDTTKTSDITFYSTRIISGTAEKGADIAISVYETVTVDGQESLKLVNGYSLTVGSTGIFSQTIALSEGKNYVVVEAKKDGKYSKASTTITRKESGIKIDLSKCIALPGQKLNW